MRTTPFYERTGPLNKTCLWEHWAGYLNARQYQFSEKQEYFSVRSAAGVYDTSPLYKYRFLGPDAETFLAGVLARDVTRCRPGSAQYTIWCDAEGYVIEDGMLLRLSKDEFMLTAADPNLAYFESLVGSLSVEINDVSEDIASLAIQGPRSKLILDSLSSGIGDIAPFGVRDVKVGDIPVIVSRTGFTGDLGYELWVDATSAVDLWDRLFKVGGGHGLVPFGETALIMTRIEAGLLLIDADFASSRYAWTDGGRSTPVELGLAWMFRDLDKDQRPFIGREAVIRDLEGGARWKMVGLVIDWKDWDATYKAAGHVPPKDHTPMMDETVLYYDGDKRAGFSTSFMYSPMMQRHIALAQVIPELATPGSKVEYEVTIDHQLHYIRAVVTDLPFYNPPHRKS
jgi:aminomethyltransferase